MKDLFLKGFMRYLKYNNRLKTVFMVSFCKVLSTFKEGVFIKSGLK